MTYLFLVRSHEALRCIASSVAASREHARAQRRRDIRFARQTVLSAVQIATSGGREDKISIRDQHGAELSVKDHSSSTGWNGRYLYHGDWTPDSRFFVYSTLSSGAHSIWHCETFAYDAHTNRFYSLDDFLEPAASACHPVIRATPFPQQASEPAWRSRRTAN